MFTGVKKIQLKGLLTLASVFVFILGYQNCGDNGKGNFASRKPASIIQITGLSADSIAAKSKKWSWACQESNGDSLNCTYRFVVNKSDTHEFTDEPYGNQTSYTKNDGTGTFWLHVQAKDETGLESKVRSSSARLDNTKPSVKGLSNDHVIRMSKPWDWGCNDETSPTCTYQFAVTTTRNHTFDNSYGVTANHTLYGGQGTYYLHVQAKDEAGNESEIKSVSVNLDNVKPVVTELSDDSTAAKSRTWNWGCDKAPCTYRFVINQSSNHVFSGDLYKTMNPPTASQTSGTGIFWIHVQAKDEIGNESSVVSVSAVLDNTLPIVTSLSSDSSPRQAKTWTWGCNKNNCSYRFAVNRLTNHTFQTTSNYGPIHTKTVNTTDNGIGTVWLHVQAKDGMNNESSVVSVSAALNDTPLTVTRLSSDPSPTKSKTWNWSCSESPSSNCTYRFEINRSAAPHTFPSGKSYGSTTTASKSSGDGTWYLHVQAKSAVKGESVVESVSVVLDNTIPTLTGLADDNIVQPSKTWDWGCSETSPSNCEYRSVVNQSANHSFSANTPYGSTIIASQSSGNGTYYLHVQARDTAGNVSGVTSVSVTLDNSGPEVTELANDSTPAKFKTWNWSCNEPSPSDCTYRSAVNKSPDHGFPDDTAYGSTTTASKSSGNGKWYLHVQVKDAANNKSNVVSVSAILDNTAPTLTGLADDDTPAKSKIWEWSCNETCTYRYHISQCEDSPPDDGDACKTHTFAGAEPYDADTKTESQTGDGTWYIHVQAKDGAGNESQVTSVSVELYSVVQALADGPFGDHNCALFTNNAVKCWGFNNYGQLGRGNTKNLGDDSDDDVGKNLAPIDLGTKSDGTKHTARAVSIGAFHTCAILDDGSMRCWGRNNYGQLGLENSNDYGDEASEMGNLLPPVDLGTDRTAKAVSAGEYHTCAILDDNSVKCWGDSRNGRLGKVYNSNNRYLGDNSDEMGDYLVAINLGTDRTAKAISTGRYHSCALLDNNKVKCWGENNYGQLGLGDRTDRGDGTGEMGDSLPAVNLGTGRTAKAISTGDNHNCALLDNNKVKCWGYNSHGQLGLGDTGHRGDYSHSAYDEMGDDLPSVNLGTGQTAKAISTGRYHSCAILDDDNAKCWGENNYGQLGQDDTIDYGRYSATSSYPMSDLPAISLGTDRTAKIISPGQYHTCALLDNDGVKCWGRNNYGQLGLGNPNTYGDGRHNDRKMANLVEIPF